MPSDEAEDLEAARTALCNIRHNAKGPGTVMEAARGRGETPIERWDAQAEYDLGTFMHRYLHENPAPYESETALLFASCSHELRESGGHRLGGLGQRHLRGL